MPILRRCKRSFVAGLLLLTPLVVTRFVLGTVTGWALRVVSADQLHEIDVSVRRGMRQLVTTGMGTEPAAALDAQTAGEPPTVGAE